MGPHPAVAAIRLAVRRVLHDILTDLTDPADRDGAAPLVLVACSGGADSMALASALAFEAPKLGVRAAWGHRRPRPPGRPPTCVPPRSSPA